MKYLVDIRDEILIREKEPLLLEAYSYTDREWVEGDWLVGVYDGSITTIAITELEAKELIRNKELYKSIIKLIKKSNCWTYFSSLYIQCL